MTMHQAILTVDRNEAWIEQASYKTFQRLVRCALSEKLIIGAFLPEEVDSRPRYRVTTERTVTDIVFENPVRSWRTAMPSHLDITDRDAGTVQNSWAPADVLSLIREGCEEPATDGRWTTLLEEINNSVYNEALCLAHRYDQDRAIALNARTVGARTLGEWVLKTMPKADAVRFFEEWAAVGHPHHPCTKTKLGFTTNDLFDYAPEFGAVFQIDLAAIRRDRIYLRTARGFDDVQGCFKEMYPQAMHYWLEGLRARRLDPSDFVPIPVHPWQRAHVIVDLFEKEIADGVLVFTDQATIPSTATLSLRTVCPVAETFPPHLKLPIAVQATSAVREIKPELITIGPLMTDIMAALVKSDAELSAVFAVAGEMIAMNTAGDSDPAPIRAAALAAIVRTNVGRYVGADELLVPAAALFVPSPVTGLPLLLEFFHTASDGREDQLHQLCRSYVQRIIAVHMRLYLKYGIALEAHQQNALVAFAADGHLSGLVARDFGNTRICARMASRFGWSFPESIRDRIVMTDRAHVREMLLYTTLQSHIGDVITLIAEQTSIGAGGLWSAVRDEMERQFTRFGDELPKDMLNADRQAFFVDPWFGKSLLRMRVLDAHDDHFVAIDNPFLETATDGRPEPATSYA